MAKKTKSQNTELTAAQTAAPVSVIDEVASVPEEQTKAASPKLIVVQRKFDRWYVYFKGVAPKDNVGCGCKTAKSAMRYMHLLKARYGASSLKTSMNASSSRQQRRPKGLFCLSPHFSQTLKFYDNARS